MEEDRGGVQGDSGSGESHLVLNERRSKGQPGLQRGPCCPASDEAAHLVSLGWFWGRRCNPCCAQSALLGS